MNYTHPLAALAAIALTVGLDAQIQTPITATVAPVEFDYSLTTGQLTRRISTHGGSQATPIPVAAQLAFDNSQVPPQVYSSWTVGEEWIDWGVKSADSTGLISQVEIGYGTTQVDPALGGPGASLEFSLYTGTQGEAGVLGNEVLRFQLNGLPSGDGTGAVAGTAVVNIVADGIATQLPVVPDGKLGWGYTSLEIETGPLNVEFAADPSEFGPDAFGYEADQVPNQFQDIRSTGQQISSPGTFVNENFSVPLEFPFSFYGQTYTSMTVSSWGTIQFELPHNTPEFQDCLEEAPIDYPEQSIVGFTSTLAGLGGNAAIHVETMGIAPCRTTIVQWSELTDIVFTASEMTYQIKLFESTNAIEFHASVLDDLLNVLSDFFDFGLVGLGGDALGINCADQVVFQNDLAYRFTVGPENDNGSVDLVARYTAPATPSSFIDLTYINQVGSTTDLDAASFFVRLWEDDGACGLAQTSVFSSPFNPTVFQSLTQPVFGTQWVSQVDTSGFTNAVSTVVAVTTGAGPCVVPGLCVTPFGDLLVNPAGIVSTTSVAPVNGIAIHESTVFSDISFCGTVIPTQAAVIDPTLSPSIRLTNRIDLTLGF